MSGGIITYRYEEATDIVKKYFTEYPWHPLISPEEEVLEKYFNNVGILDRTGTIEAKGKEILVKIPKVLSNLTLEEVINKRVNEILEISKTRDIYLMWSGGIDSTLIFYVLLNSGLNFKVVFNKASEKEYPNLAYKISNYEFENVKPYIYTGVEQFDNEILRNPKSLVITGELGDQMIGSDANFKFTEEQRQFPAVNWIPKDVYDLAIPSLSKIPTFDITNPTVSEFLWAFNFVFKYQSVYVRKIFKMGIFPLEPYANCIHFFNTDEFQSWAINNYKDNSKLTGDKDYKIRYKEIIFKLNNDKNYFLNKRKEGSRYGRYI